MNPRLFSRGRDLDMEREPSPHEHALIRDPGLETLFDAMAGDDDFLRRAARQALLEGLRDSPEEILYRQAALRDSLRNIDAVRAFYDVAVEAFESQRRSWLGIFSRSPGGILYGAVDLLSVFLNLLSRLRRLADEHAAAFASDGFRNFFAALRAELAFCLGAARAHRLLRLKGVPLCFPLPYPAGSRRLSFSGLREPCLALQLEGDVAGDDLEADGRQVVLITGPNQGGKSTFRRSVGLAQSDDAGGDVRGGRILWRRRPPGRFHALQAGGGHLHEEREVRRGARADERHCRCAFAGFDDSLQRVFLRHERPGGFRGGRANRRGAGGGGGQGAFRDAPL